MQKFLRTLTLLAFMLVPWVSQAQNTLTVANGTVTNSNVPIHGLWADAYLRCQTIYPASMLQEAADAYAMNGGTINSLTYYLSSPASAAWTGTFEVKVTEVAATTLTGWADMAGATTVFTGTLDASSSPMVITFTTPYTYNGGNLLVEVNEIVKGNYKSASFYGEEVAGASVQGYSSASWASIAATVRDFVPKTTFTFTGGTLITCRSPKNLVAEALNGVSINLNWNKVTGNPSGYQLSYKPLTATTDPTVVTVTDTNYTLSGLTPNTPYEIALRTVCSSTDQSLWVSTVANTHPIEVTNLAAATTVGAAMVTWKAPTTPVVNYQVRYKIFGSNTEGTIVTVTSPEYLITGLAADTKYEISVRSNCGTNLVSDWTTIIVNTEKLGCLAGFGERQIGEGTSTTGYLPGYAYYNYAYTQQIYTAAEIGANGAIEALAVMPATVNAEATDRTMKIYLGHTNVATSGTWLTPADLTLVYSGTTHYVANEWYTFNFQTPFTYNGTDNLVVIFVDESGYWKSGNSFYCHEGPAGAGTSLYTYNDNNPYTSAPTATPSSTANRNNMKFIGSCTQYAPCAAPVATVTNVMDNSVSISWLPGYQDAAWDVAFRADTSNEWITVAIGTTDRNYTFTGLDGNTDYLFRVQYACSDETLYADSVEVHTLCTLALPYTEDFEGVEDNNTWPECWNNLVSYSATYPIVNNAYNHTEGEEAQYSMRMGASLSSQAYNMIATAPIHAAGNDIYVSFWARMNSYTYGSPYIQAGVMTDLSDTSTFIPLTEVKVYDGQWHKYEFCTKNLDANATYFVAWKYYGYSTSYPSQIDDIVIDTIPEYNVTLIVTNQENDPTPWGTVNASALHVLWGDIVTFSATPDEFKRLAAWYDGADIATANILGEDTNYLKVTVTSDTTITAYFGYGQFEVLAKANYEEMGTIDALNNIYNNNMYDYASLDTFVAVPNYGYRFYQWFDTDSNLVLGNSDTLVIEVLRSYSLVARFTIDGYVLDVQTEHGTIDSLGTYTFGHKVNNIHAIPDEHYQFSHWADANGDTISTVNNFSVRMVHDTILYPVFVPMVYNVNIVSVVDGDETSDAIATYAGAGEFTYLDEDTLRISNVDNHYTFNGWSVRYTNNVSFRYAVYYPDPTDYENYELVCFTIGDNNDTTFFTFDWDNVPATHTAEYYANEANRILMTGFHLPANTPSYIYSANYYTYDPIIAMTADSSYAFVVENNMVFAAQFAAQQYTVTIASDDENMGSVNFTDEQYEGLYTITVPYNTVVGINAEVVNGEYSSFLKWSDESHIRMRDIVVTQDTNLTAIFSVTTYAATADIMPIAPVTAQYELEDVATLTLSNDEPGWGEVVTVTAEAGEHWIFDHWESWGADGYNESTENPYSEMIFGTTNFFAFFVPDTHTVAATIADETFGSVEVEETVVAHFDNATVTYIDNSYDPNNAFADANGQIFGLPGYGYHFDSWTDTNDNFLSDENPFTFEVSQDTVVVATVAPNMYNVMAISANGAQGTVGVNTMATDNYDYAYLSQATLLYDTAYGYRFGWWANADGDTLSLDRNYKPVVLKDTTIYAHFVKDLFTVAGEPEATCSMMGYVEGSTDSAEYGDVVSLTAVEHEGYEFVGWVDAEGEFIQEDGISVLEIDDNVITLAAGGDADHQWTNNDTTVYALYTFRYYPVDVVVVPNNTFGTATGVLSNRTLAFPEILGYSSRVSLTAEAAESHDFVAWIDQFTGDTLSTDPNYIYTVTGEAVVEAHFQLHPYVITLATDDETKGTANWATSSTVNQTVANGTATSSYVPIYGLYCDAYNKTQILYSADMLSAIDGGEISSLTFYAAQTNVDWGAANYKVYLTETEETTLNTFADVAEMTQVYDGSLSIVNNQMVITLDAPFTYNGGNLLMAVYQDATGDWVSSTWQGETVNGASLHSYSYSSLDAITVPNQRNFIPKTTFTATVTGELPGVKFDDMTAYVDYDRSVSVVAEANYGYDFVGWAAKDAEGNFIVDDDSNPVIYSTDETYVVSNVDRDSNIVALFTEHMFTVLTSTDGNGDVALDPESATSTYAYNSEVTLTATATEGNHMHFLNWTAKDADGNVIQTVGDEPVDSIFSTENPMTFVVSQDTHFVANFEIDTHTVVALPNNEDFGGVYVEEPGGGASGAPYEVQIGDETNISGYFPFYTLYNYSIAENLFLASELTEAGVSAGPITSLSWYANNAPGYEQQGLNIWMANVTDEALTTTSHLATDMTQVYSDGAMTPAIGWNEFVLNGDFEWDGTSNVLILVQRNNGNWSSTVQWQVSNTDFNSMSYKYQDAGAYDVTTPNTMSTAKKRANIIIKGQAAAGGATQGETTVADGTNTNNYLPIYGFYGDAYLKAQMIYPGSMLTDIPAGAEISELTFEAQQANVSWGAANFKVYLTETTDATISEFADVAAMTQVYDGSLSIVDNQMVVAFDNNYTYNGGNLLMAFYEDATGDYVTSTWYGISATGASMSGYSYSSLAAINNQTQRNFLPKVTIDWATSGSEPAIPYAASSEVTVDYNTTGVKVYAKANDNYHFKRWTDVAGNEVATAPVFTVEPAVLNDTTFIAVFAPDTFMIATLANEVQGYVTPLDTVGAYNEQVTLTAVANDGYQFDHWAFYDSEMNLVAAENSTTNPLTFTVTGDTMAVAFFDFRQYVLNVNVENGTVSVDRDALNLFDSVETVDSGFYFGTQLTLTANAGEHHHNFKGWYDANENLVSETATYLVTMFDDIDLTAKFEVDTFTVLLAVNDELMGEIEDADEFEPKHIYGEEIVLNAVAADGYHWTTWMANDVAIDATNPMTFTVTEDVTLKAVFAVNTYDANAIVELGDEVNSTEGTTTGVLAGTEVTFTAIAGNGYTFDEWRNVNGDSISDLNPLTITVESDTTLVAFFTHNIYTVETTTPFEEMGLAVASQATANYGDSVTFTATPEYGYHFVSWTDENGLDTNAAVIKLEITGNTLLTANFDYDTFALVAVSTDLTRGTVEGAGDYPYGAIVTLTAVPAEGYVFKQWVDQDDVVYTTANVNVLVDDNKEYTAYFITEGEFTVTALAAHGTVTGAGGYSEGETATLNVITDFGYAFAGWYINDVQVSNDPTYSFVVTQDTTVVAMFTTNTYHLTLLAENGTVTGDGDYAFNTVANITATPNEHYHFVVWSDGNINANRAILITGDMQLEAIFAIDENTVTAAAINGTVNGAGTYTYGSTATLVAVPTSVCYSFDGWMINNEIVSTNTTYTFTVTDDVVLVASFTAVENHAAPVTVSSCGAYTWHGIAYAANGTYTFDTVDANGCALVETLNLTVNTPVTPAPENVSACGSYTWHGVTYTGSGIHTYPTTDIHGCDVEETLNLTIYTPVNPTAENVTACESYNWHGVDRTVTGTYTYPTTDVHGCDVVETLNLTINHNVTGTDEVVNCGPYSWNGTNYTTSGVYTATLPASNGCDSVVTLTLTIGNSTSSAPEVVSTCDSYEWNGNTYTTSGVYYYHTTGSLGCDSTATLDLTITPAAEVTITEEACSSFTWTGYTDLTYTTSGIYTFTTDNGQGCLTIYTLYLTINQPVVNNLTVEAIGSYEWNGTVYTESGEYTYTYTAANGCDSIVNLNLTVTPVYTVTLVSANEAMGTVNESGTIVENGYFTAVATANEGYEFVEWRNASNEVVSHSATYVFQVTEDITLTAIFQERVGIEDVDMENVTIYSTDTRIFVNGAEGKDVYVYDVNGRMMYRELNAPETIEFRMTATGVYLVKVGNAPAKRVVVVR